MTAIALLNPKSDPHIVADTLLSNSGPDPNPKKSVWLPALGQIPSEWNKGEELWHITRLGRKTLILPNHSGILAFAADECAAAISFFGELGNVFQIQWQYEKNIRLSRNMIDAVLLSSREYSRQMAH